MSQALAFPSTQKTCEDILKRRCDRVSMDTAIAVRGSDARGEIFGEQTKTVLVSRLGGTILLRRILRPESLVTVRNLATGREALCKVLAQVGEQADGYLYGVSLIDPTVNLWDISFPPRAKAKNAAARLLMRCGACPAREIVYLDEMEAEVFAVNESLARFCSNCGRRTTWLGTTLEAGKSAGHQHRTQNDRAHPRVPARLRSCIRQVGFGDEILITSNVSRGGFSFKSPNHYYSGSMVQVAVPYSPGNGNVFVPARIVCSHAIPSEGLVEHGAAYIQSDDPQAFLVEGAEPRINDPGHGDQFSASRRSPNRP